MTDRPWVATWNSNEHGWNLREGVRYATRERAEARANNERENGAWDVRVIYAPVIKAALDADR